MRHTELFALPNCWRVVAFFVLLSPLAGRPAFAQHEHASSEFEIFVAAEGLAGGRYLQTAITRPAIENWEDEDGLIPQNITGALVESRRQIDTDAGMQLSGGVGAAPTLRNEDNQPLMAGSRFKPLLGIRWERLRSVQPR